MLRHSTQQPAAAANFNQISPSQHWGPKRRLRCAIALSTELGVQTCGDDAAIWAHRSLVEKNKLTAADAQSVEESFQARLANFAALETEEAPKGRGSYVLL